MQPDVVRPENSYARSCGASEDNRGLHDACGDARPAIERAIDVSVPFGENTRYDLILDDGESLRRVQCKTGRLRRGAIEFATASSYYHHPNEKPTQRHYLGQVDSFAVYCRQTGGVYLIPIGHLPIDRASPLGSRLH